MKMILTFVEQNYLWFLIIAIILILALIGYYVDIKKEEVDSPFKKEKKSRVEVVSDESMQNLANSQAGANISLNEMLNNQSKINQQNNK